MADCGPQTSIAPIKNTGCISNPDAPEVQWTNRDETLPFINPRTCEYSIVVDKRLNSKSNPYSVTQWFEVPGEGTTFDSRMEKYTAYGVAKLFEFYNKALSADLGASPVVYGTFAGAVAASYVGFLARESEAHGSSYHVDTRPNYIDPVTGKTSGFPMKVLVTLPFDILNAYSDVVYNPADNYEAGSTVSMTYDIRLIKKQLDFVAKVIREHYGTRHGVPGANIRNLNLREEANKIENFVLELQKFLGYNGIDVNLDSVLNTRDEQLRFIFNVENYELLDVIHINGDSEEKYLRVGANVLTTKETVSSTTAHFIYRGLGLFVIFNNHLNPPWSDFVETYVYPSRQISLTVGANFKSDIYIGGGATLHNVTLTDIDNKLDEGIKLVNRVLGIANITDDIVNESRSLIPFVDHYVKTQTQKQQEDSVIFNRTLHAHLSEYNTNLFHNTDTGGTFDIKGLRDIVTSTYRSGSPFLPTQEDAAINEYWERIFNHIDWRYLVGKIAQCIGMDPELIDPLLLEIINKLIYLLNFLPNMDFTTIDIPDNWGFVFDITEDFANYIIGIFIKLVQTLFGEMLSQVITAFDEMCEEKFDYESVSLEGLISNKVGGSSSTFYDTLSSGIGDGTGTSALLKELMRDISAVLNTSELCLLVNGRATQKILTIVYNIILLEKYSPFHDRFDSKESVSGFFASLGGLVSPSVCRFQPTWGAGPDICADDGFNEAVRRSLLEQKEGITSDQVEDQIAAERQRRIDLINQLSEIFTSPEDTLSDKMMELINNSDIGDKMTNHPSTQVVLDQVMQTVFYPSLISLATEALGFRTTPYYKIEHETDIRGLTFKLQEEVERNKGLVNLMTDEGLTANLKKNLLYRYFPEDPPDIDSFYNYNIWWGPEYEVVGDSGWRIAHKWFGKAISNRYDPEVANFTVDPTIGIPAWWDVTSTDYVNMPQIHGSFFSRSPFVGPPNPVETDIGFYGLPPSPTLRNYNAPGGLAGFGFIGDSAPIQPDQYLLETFNPGDPLESNFAIDAYLDLPSVLAEGLVPEGTGDITREQQGFVGVFIEALERYGASILDFPLADFYPNIFNEVMKSLYLLITDSEIYNDDNSGNITEILNNIKENFKDPTWLRELSGIENTKLILGDKLFSAISTGGDTSELVNEALIEAAGSYFIRLYILETFLKGTDMLITRPEKRGIIRLNDAGDDIAIRPTYDEDNTAGMLDLMDILDPALVSYIFEYIKFSTSDNRLGECAFWEPFKDLIQKVVDRELEDSVEESISIYVTDSSGANVGEALAHYPISNSTTPKKDALKYFIAKELINFVRPQSSDAAPDAPRGFQDFVELKEVLPDWAGPDITPKRPLMFSFLDKLDTIGWSVSSDQLPESAFGPNLDSPWIVNGPGLYLEFYLRDPETGDEIVSGDNVWFWDEIPELATDWDSYTSDFPSLTKVGLRLCMRESAFSILPQGTLAFVYFTDSDTPDKERSLTAEKGIPIVTIERSWTTAMILAPEAEGVYLGGRAEKAKALLDYMKNEMINDKNFRILFEYACPVKKLFIHQFMMTNSAQSLFASNTEDFGILPASVIDPENFVEAKAIIRGILENVQNFDNYTYIDSETEAAGGTGNIILKKSIGNA